MTINQAGARLEQAGCDRVTLRRILVAIANTAPLPSLPSLQGGTARELRSKLARIRRTAKDIRALLGTFAGNMTAILEAFPLPGQTPPGQGEYRRLPHTLEAFAEWFEHVSASVSNPSFAPADASIGVLVGYVESATGRACDSEVCALIAGLRKWRGYRVDAHKRWKSRHKRLINALAHSPVFLQLTGIPAVPPRK